tara:strand:- start:418 stop:726 length:309 start_codon:yes stop_codon:yes gene_type:complete
MATKATTQAHLTAVGMSGSDAQITRLLAALGTTDHDDVAAFVTAALARFGRNEQFSGLSQSDEQKLWAYRNLWAKVRGGADDDADLLTEGWKHSTAAFAALS